MAHLSDIPEIGWKVLWRHLQAIVVAINTNEPVAGSGLRIDQRRGGGTLISLADQPKNTTQNQSGAVGGGGGSAGVPVKIQAFDTNNNPVTITVMTDGNGFGTSTLVWQPVNVVEPATCVQSTITVLEQSS